MADSIAHDGLHGHGDDMTLAGLLDGSRAIVTGASRGIGASVAAALYAAGASVGLISRDQDALRQVARNLAKDVGPRVATATADVSDPEQLRSAIDGLVERLGPPSILVNNAGTIDRTPAAEMTAAAWQRVLDTNLSSTMVASAAVLPFLRELGGGSIVNIASLSAHFGIRQAASYGASKAGILGLTRALALEWSADAIRVNAVSPGYITTDFTQRLKEDPDRAKEIAGRIPLGRWGRPDDVAGAVLYLSSALASWVTGQVLVVDGGYSVHG